MKREIPELIIVLPFILIVIVITAVVGGSGHGSIRYGASHSHQHRLHHSLQIV